jgi:hypothetical protein
MNHNTHNPIPNFDEFTRTVIHEKDRCSIIVSKDSRAFVFVISLNKSAKEALDLAKQLENRINDKQFKRFIGTNVSDDEFTWTWEEI